MRNWTFWEWVAYACLLVGAVILAADTGFRISPNIASFKPSFVYSPLWGFAPLALIFIATIILIVNAVGWLGPYGFWRPTLTTFLERDSQSDLMGVQTFPTVSYIQISVKVSRPIKACKAWITRAEYRPDKNSPFSLEHNERVPCNWSKHGGANEFEADISPLDPPLRINVAVFTATGLGYGRETPTNLLPWLQRVGEHKLEVHISGDGDHKRFSKIVFMIIYWDASGAWAELC